MITALPFYKAFDAFIRALVDDLNQLDQYKEEMADGNFCYRIRVKDKLTFIIFYKGLIKYDNEFKETLTINCFYRLKTDLITMRTEVNGYDFKFSMEDVESKLSNRQIYLAWYKYFSDLKSIIDMKKSC